MGVSSDMGEAFQGLSLGMIKTYQMVRILVAIETS